VIGSLIAAIAAAMPAVSVTMFDTDQARAERAALFGADFALLGQTVAPSGIDGDFDCVFQASGQGAGLATALAIAGFEADIIDVSWYGDATVNLSLGQAFHSRRLRLISSQVGAIAPRARGRFDHRRRMAVVQRLLGDMRLDSLLGTRVTFEDLPRKMGSLLTGRGGLCPVVVYPG